MSIERVTPWIKASASDAGGNCVEQRLHAGVVELRDTKDRGAGPVLPISPANYRALLRAATQGEYEDLI